jgi:hypothetical protein
MRFSGALWMEAIRTLTSISLVTTPLTLSRPAGAQAGAPLFVADQEACFGRVYDRHDPLGARQGRPHADRGLPLGPEWGYAS